jgi:hypothetical protein
MASLLVVTASGYLDVNTYIDRNDTIFARRVTFHLGAPHRGYYGRVQRDAVMYPLVGHPRDGLDPGTLVRHIRGYARLVMHHESVMLDAFEDAGVMTRSQTRDLANCRPAFVKSRPRAYVCGQTNFCPHCMARWAATVWKRVDAALFPPGPDGSRPEHAIYDLIVARQVFDPQTLAVYSGLKMVFDEYLADKSPPRGHPIPSRQLERRRLSRYRQGAVENFQVKLSKEGWSFTIRQLHAVRSDQDLRIKNARLVRLNAPSRHQVASRVAWVFRYPRTLLAAGDREHVRLISRLLVAQKTRRLSECYGIFKAGKTARL